MESSCIVFRVLRSKGILGHWVQRNAIRGVFEGCPFSGLTALGCSHRWFCPGVPWIPGLGTVPACVQRKDPNAERGSMMLRKRKAKAEPCSETARQRWRGQEGGMECLVFAVPHSILLQNLLMHQEQEEGKGTPHPPSQRVAPL